MRTRGKFRQRLTGAFAVMAWLAAGALVVASARSVSVPAHADPVARATAWAGAFTSGSQPTPSSPATASITPMLSPAPVPSSPPTDGEVDCRLTSCIALTFDDGPGAYTAELLSMLEAADATATFFLVGSRAAERPGLVREMVAAGFEIGNHTWSHPELTRLEPAEVVSEVARTSDLLEQITGVRPLLLRPPYGAHNAEVDAIVGMPEILWDLDTNDWDDLDTELVARRAVLSARPGSIVLMHDIHPTTVQAVPTILEALTRAGYTFVTVSELLADRQLDPGVSYLRQ